ncbi:acetylxylan esterase [Microbacterium sorbitolivorans]|uniref:sialate O-acetylesterase n=1 Tax=Microbacterium sorbitolivorans TaxID=1867410 RepID=UPI0013B06741|nr:sialate O-acetylesterase [Microbacterium sorbitolivorans]GGF48812.1 acetylxylan esterase [Microbacterium sorbitolivorans]
MTTHIVVLLGQSNANGSNTDYEPDGRDARDPRILVFPGSGPDAGRIVPAREPLAPIGAHPPGGMGPAGPFASRLVEMLPPDDRIVIVPITMGGTGMRSHGSYAGVWLPGFTKEGAPNLFEIALAQISEVLEAADDPRVAVINEPRIAAVLWHQGESDGGRSEGEYAADLDLVVTELRRRIPDAAGAPFIVGQLPRDRLRAFPDHQGVCDALRRLPERIPNTGFADAPPLGHVNDGSTHLTAEGQRLLGINYFEAYRELVG